jgi:hypothetical protein
MARLFSDEDFPRPAVEALRHLGHHVLRMEEIGLAGQGIKDEVVLERASLDLRIVLTINHRDFMRLHRTVAHHAGIISCTSDTDFPALAARIHAALANEDSLEGRLIRVTRPGPAPGRRSATSSE